MGVGICDLAKKLIENRGQLASLGRHNDQNGRKKIMVQPIRIRAGSSKPMLDLGMTRVFAQSPIIEKVILGAKLLISRRLHNS
jgi:hypothetical protein